MTAHRPTTALYPPSTDMKYKHFLHADPEGFSSTKGISGQSFQLPLIEALHWCNPNDLIIFDAEVLARPECIC